jgi:3-phosphoglycerate kinase
VLHSLLASRTYTQDQVTEKLAKQVDALKECVSAMARGKVEQLTDEEVFAVNEKQAIILEGSIDKNERLAFVRALQLLVD